MRRAVIERSLLSRPAAEAAALIEALLEQASAGGTAARAAALALVSAVAHRRLGAPEALAQIHAAAGEAGLARAVVLCGEDAPVKTLPARARLPEVGLNTDACFPAVPAHHFRNDDGSVETYVLSDSEMRRMAVVGRTFFGASTRTVRDLVRHPSGAFLSRVLRTRWIREGDVLLAATRRPSTPEIAIAIAADDRWLASPSVRAALAANPFTPAWLTVGLALSRPLAPAQPKTPSQSPTTRFSCSRFSL